MKGVRVFIPPFLPGKAGKHVKTDYKSSRIRQKYREKTPKTREHPSSNLSMVGEELWNPYISTG